LRPKTSRCSRFCGFAIRFSPICSFWPLPPTCAPSCFTRSSYATGWSIAWHCGRRKRNGHTMTAIRQRRPWRPIVIPRPRRLRPRH